jgi:hypothetical protein
LLSTSAFVACGLQKRTGAVLFQYVLTGGFVFQDCQGKPENFAWHLLQSLIIGSPDFGPGERYAIITDSDLGNHEAYNSRLSPFFGDVFLSEGIDLLYASAERGKSALNLVMSECDAAAAKIRDDFMNGQIPEASLRQVSSGPCSRIVVLADESKQWPRSWLPFTGELPLKYADPGPSR